MFFADQKQQLEVFLHPNFHVVPRIINPLIQTFSHGTLFFSFGSTQAPLTLHFKRQL